MLILHAGCGNQPLPQSPLFGGGKEVRLDIDPDNEPDIVASIHDMGDIGPFEAIWSSHCLEHLHWHDAEQAMREFHRVLKPNGFAVVMVPDLEGIKPTEDVIYHIEGLGPITGLDMLFGYRGYTATNPYMMHKCGFVAETLTAMFKRAGFAHISMQRTCWNLIGTGVKLCA